MIELKLMRVNDMIENVKFSIVLRRKTKLQASFRDKHNIWEYVYMCVCVCVGGGGLGGEEK